MLLKNAGIDHPLAVIFVGASFGICAFMRDIYASLFCLAIIVLLFSVKRFPFMISGILAG